jgi:hypothetical protein
MEFVFLFLVLVFVISFIIFLFYNSYYIQTLIYRFKRKNKFVIPFLNKVKGTYYSQAYFAVSHKVVRKDEYKNFSERFKLNFSKCHNVVLFKTKDADFELFFYLIKEDGLKYSEILTIRVFPKDNHINSEGNIEKNYSRLNIFTNNRYLTQILENEETLDYLNWLLRKNGDILLVSPTNLHYKIFLNERDVSISRILDMIKALHKIKNKIYRKGVLEY